MISEKDYVSHKFWSSVFQEVSSHLFTFLSSLPLTNIVSSSFVTFVFGDFDFDHFTFFLFFLGNNLYCKLFFNKDPRYSKGLVC